MATFVRLCHRCHREHICRDAIVDCACPDCVGASIVETTRVRVGRDMTTTPTEEAVDAVGAPPRPDGATADPDHRRRTIRVVSVFVQSPERWRSDVAKFSRGYRNGRRPDLQGGEAARIRAAAATATLWDLPVGIVTGVREERA